MTEFIYATTPRAGAVRFREADDVETWGLIERNEPELDDELFTRQF